MNCPYCGEEVVDTAIVCKTCRRDFSLAKSLLDRIAKLEAELATAEKTIPDGPVSSASTSESSNIRIRAKSFLAVVVASGGCLIWYWFFVKNHFSTQIFLVLSIASPALGGFIAGLAIRGSHFRLYCLLGLIVGVIDFIGTGQILDPGKFDTYFYFDNLVSMVPLLIVGQPILFRAVGSHRRLD